MAHKPLPAGQRIRTETHVLQPVQATVPENKKTKLVTGAKTRMAREVHHTMVNEMLYSWNTAPEVMKANKWTERALISQAQEKARQAK